MAFTTVPDKNAGDVFTQAMWATYLEANLNSGVARMLADVLLGADTATIDMTSIPATFLHLLVVGQVRSTVAAVNDSLLMLINNDVGTNYDQQKLAGDNATASVASQAAQGSANVAPINGASATAAFFSSFFILIPSYAGVTANKNWLSLGGAIDQTPTTTNWGIRVWQGSWKTAATAINRLTFKTSASNLKAASRITLYGLPG